MATFRRTSEFDAWLKALRDPIGKARILARIRAAEAGNFGDAAPVGGGVLEMRIHVGPGYRVYFCRRGEVTTCCCVGVTSLRSAGISAPRRTYSTTWRTYDEEEHSSV